MRAFQHRENRVTLRDRARLLALLPTAGGPLATAVVALELLSGVLPALSALSLAWVISRVSEPTDVGLLTAVGPALLGYAGVLVLSQALEALSTPLQYFAKARIDGRRRTDVLRVTAACQTIEVLEEPEVRELVRLAKAEPGNWTERTPGDGCLAQTRMCAEALGLIASCGILATFAWWLIPVVAIPSAIVQALWSRHGVEFMRQWRRGIREGMHADVWSKMLIEPSLGKEVRIFGFARLAADRMRHHVLRMFEPVWAVGARNLREQWVKFWLVGGGLGVCFVVVARAASQESISVSLASALLMAAWGVYQSIAGYDARAIVGALPGEHAWTALRQRLSTTRADDPDSGSASPVPAGEPAALPAVRFEGVGFRYPGTSASVLDALDLEIRPGELLAIVGANGAGKSTLIKLLSGLYRPTSGRITVDGTDVWHAGIARWRQRITVVFQEFARYHLSMAANISLTADTGRQRDRAALAEVVEQAGLSDVVARMPNGLDTPLTRAREGGVELSGGQWQQVILARALYAVRTGAGLLVLDEPTAHLDVRSEAEIFGRLARRKGDFSVVLISHRLSTVRAADRIVLLDGGRISECGSHDELIARGGQYARMFALQAERFSTDSDWRGARDEPRADSSEGAVQ
ncbi:ABC transporter ATP-binding protein [Streptomyces sp. DSM 44915]|uniref:ABC transporter ATP-binding protein n=1 Tax=Streptomyces chisholmiae TaxID=3075540 RepID=A0ABU2JUS0_9ACTN|nr:ABC transporter ATP-binding protein [Streptomyces sp. DSM 44915]MDT0268735.1 ABC transporter ATP-binding protein [Streptomyces sp. DSM 44915]